MKDKVAEAWEAYEKAWEAYLKASAQLWETCDKAIAEEKKSKVKNVVLPLTSPRKKEERKI